MPLGFEPLVTWLHVRLSLIPLPHTVMHEQCQSVLSSELIQVQNQNHKVYLKLRNKAASQYFLPCNIAARENNAPKIDDGVWQSSHGSCLEGNGVMILKCSNHIQRSFWSYGALAAAEPPREPRGPRSRSDTAAG